MGVSCIILYSKIQGSYPSGTFGLELVVIVDLLESAFDVTGLESEQSKNNETRFTDRTNRSDKPRPISIPGSLSSAPAKKSAGDA